MSIEKISEELAPKIRQAVANGATDAFITVLIEAACQKAYFMGFEAMRTAAIEVIKGET